ncbi:hypothetical protein HXX76_016087 [Chlamydomonas incerta]|uniref:Uncharacterized protein n=1 Tax=Chlamydomonas incerta TaxID=51695 RepID=A0A835S7U9_CHLIN|nr:hypothetical protein HXX76_016087 [Chlamydomonas incerta]|eukprot:KAG2422362.1 hypothetical protein HXX76_016087 [Chlamydomonas incerta]
MPLSLLFANCGERARTYKVACTCVEGGRDLMAELSARAQLELQRLQENARAAAVAGALGALELGVEEGDTDEGEGEAEEGDTDEGEGEAEEYKLSVAIPPGLVSQRAAAFQLGQARVEVEVAAAEMRSA